MNDDRLGTLLAERADGARDMHPTLDGVESVVARRARRRRRHRLVGSVAAVVIVGACVGGAIALSGTGDDSVPPITDGFAPPHEVPAVGIQLEGFLQRQFQTGPLDLGERMPFSAAVFRSGDSLTDGLLSVMVEPPNDAQGAPEVQGDPTLDLDGDGDTDAHTGGNEAGMGIGWALADGSIVTVAPDGISEEAAIAYAREIFGPTLDLDDIPSPAALPERVTWSLPDPRGPLEARVSYDAEGGRRITVLTTNQPGYFDLLQGETAFGFGDLGFEEVPLGPSFLGPGQAILQDNGDGRAYAADYALVRTDAGLTVEITGENVDADIIRDLITTGAFVEVSPRSEGRPPDPTTTTVPAGPTTTAIAPGTGTVTLSDIYITTSVTNIELLVTFDAPVPRYGEVFVGDITGLGCAAGLDEDVDGVSPDSPWAWVSLGAGIEPLGDHVTRTSSDDPYLVCGNGVGSAWLALPVSSDPGSTATATDEGNQLRITVTFPPSE